MGQLREVQPVKFIVGVLAIGQDVLDEARTLIERELGAIDLTSLVWPFTSTDYYAEEMAADLLRQFVSLSNLGEPGKLVEMKLVSNVAELADAQGRNRGQRRGMNLDPGYISPAKLVLASTKDYSHRVYLGQGIHAEATLRYHAGGWQAWPWTYPDYAEQRYHEFFVQVRRRLLEQLRSQGTSQELSEPQA